MSCSRLAVALSLCYVNGPLSRSGYAPLKPISGDVLGAVLSMRRWHERSQAITEGRDDDGMRDDARDRVLCSFPHH